MLVLIHTVFVIFIRLNAFGFKTSSESLFLFLFFFKFMSVLLPYSVALVGI